MCDTEYIHCRVDCSDGDFVILVFHGTLSRFEFDCQKIVAEGYKKKRMYDGPRVRHIAHAAFKNRQKCTGWIFGISSTPDFHQLLQKKKMLVMLRKAKSVNISCAKCQGPSKLLEVLNLCENCEVLAIFYSKAVNVVSSYPKTTVSLRKVTNLRISCDVDSREQLLQQRPFYELFRDVHPISLHLHGTPITDEAVKRLFSGSICALTITGVAKIDLVLIFQAMENCGVQPQTLAVGSSEAPQNVPSLPLKSVVSLVVSDMSGQSVCNILHGCPKELRRLSLSAISGVLMWKAQFLTCIASHGHTLESLSVYKCGWFSLKWFNWLCREWVLAGNPRLKEFCFDESCQLQASSFAEGGLDSSQSRLTSCVKVMGSPTFSGTYEDVRYLIVARGTQEDDPPPPYTRNETWREWFLKVYTVATE